MTIKRRDYESVVEAFTKLDGDWCKLEDHERIVTKIASHRDKLLEEVSRLRAEVAQLRDGMPDKIVLTSLIEMCETRLDSQCECYTLPDGEGDCSCDYQAQMVIARDWLRKLSAKG